MFPQERKSNAWVSWLDKSVSQMISIAWVRWQPPTAVRQHLDGSKTFKLGLLDREEKDSLLQHRPASGRPVNLQLKDTGRMQFWPRPRLERPNRKGDIAPEASNSTRLADHPWQLDARQEDPSPRHAHPRARKGAAGSHSHKTHSELENSPYRGALSTKLHANRALLSAWFCRRRLEHRAGRWNQRRRGRSCASSRVR